MRQAVGDAASGTVTGAGVGPVSRPTLPFHYDDQ